MHSNVSSDPLEEGVSACESRAKPLKLAMGLGALVLIGYWLPVFNALRVDWSINPQYYYGWSVPLLALGLFRLRWNSRPAAGTANTRLVGVVALVALMALLPIRLIEEANPEWR